jgi:hypothetical protein
MHIALAHGAKHAAILTIGESGASVARRTSDLPKAPLAQQGRVGCIIYIMGGATQTIDFDWLATVLPKAYRHPDHIAVQAP